ncbi:glycoside hydrolase family 127 protein [Streptomyces coelicoflavus]|uniref:glycoside hydrolase family 127 protein n=1 Tax=Streptomyces coelicoflavus TaxID=285562 RepID=UPI003644424C
MFDHTLDVIHRRCEECGALDNLRRAGDLIPGDPVDDYEGEVFADSDVYKWLEAACWALAGNPEDQRTRAQVDDVVAVITAAQRPDGYLNSYYAGRRAAQRWSNIRDHHEMYCGGHLLQAAVAHVRATASTDLLDVAVRFADHVWSVFGPDRRPGADGHPEYETALAELARVTDKSRFTEQAAWFVAQHGSTPPAISGERYHLDHAPLTAQQEVTGHAVRALYLYCAAADLATDTGDAGLRTALDRLWRDFQDHNVYVTGGAGSRHDQEAFGQPYELGDERAYAESCASVAHFFWAWRMLLLTGSGEYRDAMDRTLHNGVLAGLGLDGETFFYVNPLADNGRHRRREWFGTACCPPNLARLMTSLPGYAYAREEDGVRIVLPVTGKTGVALTGGELRISQRTDYPHDGRIVVTVESAPDHEAVISVPAPAWSAAPELTLNGAKLTGPEDADGFVAIRRRWQPGDILEAHLSLPVTVLAAHRRIRAAHGRVALTRGPLVFCLEQADHFDADVRDVLVDPAATWEVRQRPDLLGGTLTLHGTARVQETSETGPLYTPWSDSTPPTRPVTLTAVPYALWANRQPGPMQVWLPTLS